MLQWIEEMPPDVLGVAAVGKVTHEDYNVQAADTLRGPTVYACRSGSGQGLDRQRVGS